MFKANTCMNCHMFGPSYCDDNEKPHRYYGSLKAIRINNAFFDKFNRKHHVVIPTASSIQKKN